MIFDFINSYNSGMIVSKFPRILRNIRKRYVKDIAFDSVIYKIHNDNEYKDDVINFINKKIYPIFLDYKLTTKSRERFSRDMYDKAYKSELKRKIIFITQSEIDLAKSFDSEEKRYLFMYMIILYKWHDGKFKLYKKYFENTKVLKKYNNDHIINLCNEFEELELFSFSMMDNYMFRHQSLIVHPTYILTDLHKDGNYKYALKNIYDPKKIINIMLNEKDYKECEICGVIVEKLKLKNKEVRYCRACAYLKRLEMR